MKRRSRPSESNLQVGLWEMGCLLFPWFFALWWAVPLVVAGVTFDRRLAAWVGIAWGLVFLFVAPRLGWTTHLLKLLDRLHPGYSEGLGARLKYVAFIAAPSVLTIVLLTALLAFAVRRAEGEAPRPPGSPVIAIAYSNLDQTPGFDEGTDVLISRLVDIDENGPDVGDAVDMGLYPRFLEDLVALSQFEDFGVDTHSVTEVSYLGPGFVQVVIGPTQYQAWHTNAQQEVWVEVDVRIGRVHLVDAIGGYDPLEDTLLVDPASPSQPAQYVSDSGQRGGDDNFLDVDIPG